MRLAKWLRSLVQWLARPRQVGAALLLLIVMEVYFGYLVYSARHRSIIALITVLVGVTVLASIDFYGRWRAPSSAGDTAESEVGPFYLTNPAPQWFRSYLPAWCMVSFVVALVASTWMHFQCWQDGIDDVSELASDISVAVPTYCEQPEKPTEPARCDGQVWSPWDVLASELVDKDIEIFSLNDINAAIADLAKKRFVENPDAKTERENFEELARVIGRRLRQTAGDVGWLEETATRDTTAEFAFGLGVQAVFVLWIPVLLSVSISRSRKRLARNDTDRLVPTDVRDLRILGENEPYFMPRLCFGAMLILGTNYVFSPLGLKATYAMALVDEYAPPGHTTWTLWTTSFGTVPVVAVGFVGFLIYALITATQRFVQRDLDDQSTFALLVRGLIVILLALVLSSSDLNEVAARLFVFVAGIFPLRALEAISKKVNISMDPELTPDDTRTFEGLPSIDPAKAFALRSAGIQSAYDLAATPLEELAGRVRIDPRLLGRVVDRAILIEMVGLDTVKLLDPYAIGTITQVMDLPDIAACGLSDQLVGVLRRVRERLVNDTRVDVVKKWLEGSSTLKAAAAAPPTPPSPAS